MLTHLESLNYAKYLVQMQRNKTKISAEGKPMSQKELTMEFRK